MSPRISKLIFHGSVCFAAVGLTMLGSYLLCAAWQRSLFQVGILGGFTFVTGLLVFLVSSLHIKAALFGEVLTKAPADGYTLVSLGSVDVDD